MQQHFQVKEQQQAQSWSETWSRISLEQQGDTCIFAPGLESGQFQCNCNILNAWILFQWGIRFSPLKLYEAMVSKPTLGQSLPAATFYCALHLSAFLCGLCCPISLRPRLFSQCCLLPTLCCPTYPPQFPPAFYLSCSMVACGYHLLGPPEQAPPAPLRQLGLSASLGACRKSGSCFVPYPTCWQCKCAPQVKRASAVGCQ